MSRDIKLQAWSKDHEFMGCVYEINFAVGIVKVETEAGSTHTFGIANVVLREYAGRKDKNAKDLYEGDIWKRDGYIGIVTFGYAQWSFVKAPNSKVYSYPAFYSNADSGEIVGNIYENPELIS